MERVLEAIDKIVGKNATVIAYLIVLTAVVKMSLVISKPAAFLLKKKENNNALVKK